jgi:integrase
MSPLTYLPENVRYSVSNLPKQGECPMTAHLQLVRSCNVNRKVDRVLRRGTNADLRTREYLTPAEIEKLMTAAKDGRWGHRDATLVMVAYRHGLRAKEAAELEWSQVEFGRTAYLHVRRAKSGKPSVHPIRGDELRMLTVLRKEQPAAAMCSPPNGARRLRRTPSTG